MEKSASSTFLELRQVTKSFGGNLAVNDVSLTFAAGKTYVVLGPSGCGKSTLLKMLIGLIGVDSGSITIEGDPLGALDCSKLRARFGYVIQDGGLFPHLTVRQNTMLPARYWGWSLTTLRSRIEELCELVQLPPDLLKRYPSQLSGGQRQRVSLMRALVLDPDILLLDEPLGALDPLIRSELQQQLRQIFRSLGKTVVMVTHDLHEAAFFADQIVLMRTGRIAQRGTMRDLIDSPAVPFVTQFIEAQQFEYGKFSRDAQS